MAEYDIIGDVHGSGDKLRGLLDLLGWTRDSGGARRHADRQRRVIFVGDLVDRGDDQRDVLETVKRMVDDGVAQIVMGNHEFNAISYATLHPETGLPLRAHTEKNTSQHGAFLDQLDDGEQAEWIAWFKTLPLWLELDGLRIVHACWHQESIDKLAAELGGDRFPAGVDALVKANDRGHRIGQAIEVVLKGPEMELATYDLPCFRDAGGHIRCDARVRWWNAGAESIRDLIDFAPGTETEAGGPYPAIPDLPCTDHDRSFSYSDDIPVVYGHHWREWGPDQHLDWTATTACVDFSAAKKGPLVAYQWRGERTVDPTHYVRYPAEFR